MEKRPLTPLRSAAQESPLVGANAASRIPGPCLPPCRSWIAICVLRARPVIVTPENFAAFSADPRGFLRRVAGG